MSDLVQLYREGTLQAHELGTFNEEELVCLSRLVTISMTEKGGSDILVLLATASRVNNLESYTTALKLSKTREMVVEIVSSYLVNGGCGVCIGVSARDPITYSLVTLLHSTSDTDMKTLDTITEVITAIRKTIRGGNYTILSYYLLYFNEINTKVSYLLMKYSDYDDELRHIESSPDGDKESAIERLTYLKDGDV